MIDVKKKIEFHNEPISELKVLLFNPPVIVPEVRLKVMWG
jgi:hypothetical protein